MACSQTISSAGKDLLALINDILDLARIEAGKIEVSPDAVPIAAGLGLYIVQQIVDAHEGKADVRSGEDAARPSP